MNYIDDISNIYLNLLEEGIEEKIPKLLGLVDNRVENKEDYIRWAALTFDPSNNASYITWILRMLKKGVLAGEEDGQKVKERLTQLEELKRKPQFPKDKRDINAYKTYGDLAETLDEFQGIKTKGEIKREATEEGIQFMGSSEGKEGSGISLYIVTTDEAGAKHFRTTDWCVKDPRYFNDYGPPYYYFTSEGSPSTLLHLNSNQCMDVRDRPTDLDREEKALMETEEITNYVLAEDNSEDALAFYLEKVGGGHNDEISEKLVASMDAIIEAANKSLKMFSVDEIDIYNLEEIKYYQPQASGYIEYDFTPYKEHIGDRDFLKAVSSVLQDFDMYPEDFEYNDPISEDLTGMSIYLRYENSYGRDGMKSQLESFISELENIESRFDEEKFNESFEEKMLEEGYLSSGWGSFKDKVDLENLNLKKFQYIDHSKYFKSVIDIDFPIYNQDRVFTRPLTTYKRSDHPYVAFSEFLAPLLNFGIKIEISKNTLEITYKPNYKEEKNQRDYIKELKTLKSLDEHYNFYVDQIQNFLNKFVIPEFQKYEKFGEYEIPEDLKIPIMQIKGRKESEGQQMLGLHEKTFRSFFLKKYEL
jgi:hypothetical protein